LNAVWRGAYLGKGIRAALADADGSILIGASGPHPTQIARRPAAPGLPASLLLTSADPFADRASSAGRRRLFLTGFAVLALVLMSGSYFILRAMARERAVARLQSEFVSAVSHEFRTPLTSLRQLSEMLVNDRIAGETSRHESYEVLLQASRRLQRLVESLLDFGRMESATFRYTFAPMDPSGLVESIVAEFRPQAPAECEIVLTHSAALPSIRVDREAIGVAVWNLLDNAVKYSPGRPVVWVQTGAGDDGVSIAVRDEGLGIPRDEQERVFDRFVRGAAAQRSTIKGTGIGLSMARHIVRAHGGDIRLTSTPGKGSTFTIVLPAREPEVA
jgi:signal transduction histidine kinase